ncbi:hypothetical protein MD484_g2724, partial [Candolleomyces efflorescens]
MVAKKSYKEVDAEAQPLLEGVEQEGKDLGGAQRKRCARRCRRAHIWGLSALLFIYSLIHYIIPAVHTEIQRLRDDHNIPVPPGITLGRCAEWSPAGGHPEPAEFYVDLDSPLFLSHGPLAVGEIEVKQAKHTADPNKAKVTVSVAYEDSKFLEYVEVCEVRSEGVRSRLGRWPESGVGIISVPWSPRQNGRFHVVVELPSVDEASPKKKIRSLRTQMPFFGHTFGDLADYYFGRLDVDSLDSPVNAEFVEAANITISTTNAPIRGTYKVDSDVFFITSGANIDVKLNLHDSIEFVHCGRTRSGVRSRLSTSNGPIRATYNLTTTKSTLNKYGGKFYLDADTSRADIDIDFDEAPIEHELNLDASTSFGRAQVTVSPEYDGPWIMEALFPFREVVDTRGENRPEDPTGQNRTRVLWFNDRGAFVENGAIVWDHGENRKGQIKLKSTLGHTSVVV